MISLKSSLATLAAAATLAAPLVAAEPQTVTTFQDRGGIDTQVQKYAQVCLVNGTSARLFVDTSWFGERPSRVVIEAGSHGIYRLEATGAIGVTTTKTLNVAFRTHALGVRGESGEAVVDAAWTYVQTDDCDEMPVYQFMYIGLATGKRLLLMPMRR